MWLRVDGLGDEPIFFDNMSDRSVRADTEWTRYEIVVPERPPTVTGLCFGALLVGAGIVDVDAPSLEIT